MDPEPWLLPGSRAGFNAQPCPHWGLLHMGSVFVSQLWSCCLASLCIWWGRCFPEVWEICKTLWGNCCLCIPHCLLFIPLPSSCILLHPPARLPCTALSALTCTSDTPVPRLLPPKSGSSAVIASAWYLQAPGSLSPKDILKNTEFLTRVSSGCLEKDVAQNYSNIAFSFFFLRNYWTNIRMQNSPWDWKMELNLAANTRKWILTFLLATKCFMLRNW